MHLSSSWQPSQSVVLLSSQASPAAASRMPLPQDSSDKQSAEQPSPPTVLLSSQTSPASASTIPLPQVSSERQSAEQPSPAVELPSSQTSAPQTKPSPQPVSVMQVAEQPSQPVVLAWRLYALWSITFSTTVMITVASFSFTAHGPRAISSIPRNLMPGMSKALTLYQQ